MATKKELSIVAEALGIVPGDMSKSELETTINDRKKALESIKTTEELPVSRITRNTWWCPHCDFAMPNKGIYIQDTLIPGPVNHVETCTNCGAEKIEQDGKMIAVVTR